jgi:hypothetical protein
MIRRKTMSMFCIFCCVCHGPSSLIALGTPLRRALQEEALRGDGGETTGADEERDRPKRFICNLFSHGVFLIKANSCSKQVKNNTVSTVFSKSLL